MDFEPKPIRVGSTMVDHPDYHPDHHPDYHSGGRPDDHPDAHLDDRPDDPPDDRNNRYSNNILVTLSVVHGLTKVSYDTFSAALCLG